MCGFAGIIRMHTRSGGDDLERSVEGMCERLFHRGPDDGGIWSDEQAGVALGHRRLSIIDLSPAGHQPMHSTDGSLVIAFNGEIYNFRRIREELENEGAAPPWRGYSDTEVLLAAIERWGLEEALKKCVGMFAFALWNRRERALYLGRDRLGEKPLYYGWSGGHFLFASEPKAFDGFALWEREVDQDALALFTRFGYVPAPLSIYRGFFKAQAGAFHRLGPEDRKQSSQSPLPPRPFWSLRRAAEEGRDNPFGGTEEEAADRLEGLLKEAIRDQMVSDVPLGAFLSGGVDSSLIVALMQAQASAPVRTYTVGFNEDGYQEAEHARAVARHLGTEHTEMTATAGEATSVLPLLPTLFDEPFCDPSQIPTYLVSRMTRRHVTVSLSGDGGDELFGGYNRYFMAHRLWSRLGPVPRVGRRAIAGMLRAAPPSLLDGGLGWLAPSINRYGHADKVSSKLLKLAEILDASGGHDFYLKLISLSSNPDSVLLRGGEKSVPMIDPECWPEFDDLFSWMMYHDASAYMPDDILVKVDRAAMGVSLETRVPLLDHRVVEFAQSLPLAMKVKDGKGKHILKKVLYRHVPRELIDRPKMGFAVPVGEWLRGPLREWAEDLLDEGRIRRDGFFRPELIRAKWNQHQAGTNNWDSFLWTVLMFQGWLDAWGRNRAPTLGKTAVFRDRNVNFVQAQ